MNLSKLVEGYELLRSTSHLDPLFSESGRTVLLHEDEYIKVYLLRGPENWNEIHLEIEVFMGVGRNVESSNSDLNHQTSYDVSISRSQLKDCISYIEYMLRLDEAGFTLEIVLDGCVWTARSSLRGIPDAKLLKIIDPPRHLEFGDEND